jgi:hypothetical protein
MGKGTGPNTYDTFYKQYGPSSGRPQNPTGPGSGSHRYEDMFKDFYSQVKDDMERDAKAKGKPFSGSGQAQSKYQGYSQRNQQRQNERDPYAEYNRDSVKDHYNQNMNGFSSGRRQNPGQNQSSGNAQSQYQHYANFHQSKYGQDTNAQNVNYTEYENDTKGFKYDDSGMREKYEKQYTKAKRDEEMRRAEEFEKISRDKEEIFFRDVQDKLDKGRDYADKFKDQVQTKGVFGALKGMFGGGPEGFNK